MYQNFIPLYRYTVICLCIYPLMEHSGFIQLQTIALARKKYYLEGHGTLYLSIQADSPHLNSLWEHLAPYGVFPLFSEQKKVVITYWSLVCSPGKCQSFFTPYNLISANIFFPEFSCWFLRVKWQSIWHMQYWHRSFTQLIENISLYQQFFMVQGQDVSFQKRIRRWL